MVDEAQPSPLGEGGPSKMVDEAQPSPLGEGGPSKMVDEALYELQLQ